jgi:hypothetical protein
LFTPIRLAQGPRHRFRQAAQKPLQPLQPPFRARRPLQAPWSSCRSRTVPMVPGSSPGPSYWRAHTVAQPSNATLPLSYNGARLTGDSNYSTISFSLPDGTYSYTILPHDPLGSAQSGNVTVEGSNVVVQVYAFITAMGCSSTSTATADTISLAGFSIATSGVVVQPTRISPDRSTWTRLPESPGRATRSTQTASTVERARSTRRLR